MRDWTDATKELPPENTKVLVVYALRDGSCERNVGLVVTLPPMDEHGEIRREDPAVPTWLTEDGVRYREGSVTHWMGLPPLPGESEDRSISAVLDDVGKAERTVERGGAVVKEVCGWVRVLMSEQHVERIASMQRGSEAVLLVPR